MSGAVICDIKYTRKSRFLGLGISHYYSDLFIYFAQIKTKALYSGWIININTVYIVASAEIAPIFVQLYFIDFVVNQLARQYLTRH